MKFVLGLQSLRSAVAGTFRSTDGRLRLEQERTAARFAAEADSHFTVRCDVRRPEELLTRASLDRDLVVVFQRCISVKELSAVVDDFTIVIIVNEVTALIVDGEVCCVSVLILKREAALESSPVNGDEMRVVGFVVDDVVVTATERADVSTAAIGVCARVVILECVLEHSTTTATLGNGVRAVAACVNVTATVGE